jgi:hypothetical protein
MSFLSSAAFAVNTLNKMNTPAIIMEDLNICLTENRMYFLLVFMVKLILLKYWIYHALSRFKGLIGHQTSPAACGCHISCHPWEPFNAGMACSRIVQGHRRFLFAISHD